VDIRRIASDPALLIAAAKRQQEPVETRYDRSIEQNLAGDSDSESFAGVLAIRELATLLGQEPTLDAVREQRNTQQEEQRARLQMELGNRTRQALAAYLTQQNLPQQEAQNALYQILGIDFYA
jgi:hypothetical protein